MTMQARARGATAARCSARAAPCCARRRARPCRHAHNPCPEQQPHCGLPVGRARVQAQPRAAGCSASAQCQWAWLCVVRRSRGARSRRAAALQLRRAAPLDSAVEQPLRALRTASATPPSDSHCDADMAGLAVAGPAAAHACARYYYISSFMTLMHTLSSRVVA